MTIETQRQQRACLAALSPNSHDAAAEKGRSRCGSSLSSRCHAIQVPELNPQAMGLKVAVLQVMKRWDSLHRVGSRE